VYLVTGAGGQLGRALLEEFGPEGAVGLTRAEWDVEQPPPPGFSPELILHAAAWTDVDGAEADPQGAAAANVGGTANVAALGAPLVYYSTDYVFDGRKGDPYLESDGPNPLSAYGRTKLHGEAAAGERAWIVRSSWLFGPTGKNFVRTMLRLGEERDEVAVVGDQRGSPTAVGHRRATTSGRRSTRSRTGRVGGAGCAASRSSSTATRVGSVLSTGTSGAASCPIRCDSRRESRASNGRT
jgi:dTDP-4-dehydrorhamnose reductase